MTKSELIELLLKHKVTCKFNNGNFGEIQKCKDVDTSGYGYLNLYDDYDKDLNCIYDNRFDIVKIYCGARHEPTTIAQYLYEDYKAFIKSESEPNDLRLCDALWFENCLEPLLNEFGVDTERLTNQHEDKGE